MKIHLQITTPDGAVRSLELRQTEVAIGRNPASPVTFAGDEAKGVSWDHATIRVDGSKILIADAASSNGTLLNDKMLPPNQPTVLKVKDRIQLGYTGPKIDLLAFDPVPAEPIPPKVTSAANRTAAACHGEGKPSTLAPRRRRGGIRPAGRRGHLRIWRKTR